MRSKAIVRYIHFGGQFQFLQRAQSNYGIHGANRVLSNIDGVFTYLDEFELVVTKRAGRELHEFRDELANRPEDAKLTQAEADKLKRIMGDLFKTLLAEAGGNIAFIVTDKRIDASKLLNDISSLMAPNVFDSLSGIAQYDFKQSGRCIAFELPTAAAFHLMRGTEEVLRCFYLHTVKRNRISPLLWGPMVSALRKRRSPPPDVLLNNLDNIRRSFRNPTQHPEKIYDIQEVQDLFALCVDVVNRMSSLMK